ncbi:MAG TPA: DUF2269 domain-containing protein [Burkholderiaceae bacterium]|jgi:uncharacterized membrane protein|nr:DUF2269 domain-containing protein [Burkholderiaceae bacterium]
MSYQLLKSLHLLGVVLFLGNIIVTAAWKALADRTRIPSVIAHSQRMVTFTDVVFTATGAALIAVTGQLMAGGRDAILATPWLTWAYGLFIATGLLWLFVLIPIQWQQARMARGFEHGNDVPESYWRLSRRWALFGSIATLLPLANLYVMVFKPH